MLVWWLVGGCVESCDVRKRRWANEPASAIRAFGNGWSVRPLAHSLRRLPPHSAASLCCLLHTRPSHRSRFLLSHSSHSPSPPPSACCVAASVSGRSRSASRHRCSAHPSEPQPASHSCNTHAQWIACAWLLAAHLSRSLHCPCAACMCGRTANVQGDGRQAGGESDAARPLIRLSGRSSKGSAHDAIMAKSAHVCSSKFD